MAKKRAFTFVYTKRFVSQLQTIEAKYLSLIRDTIEEQLGFEPDTPTRNRKRLEAPGILGAAYEIRFGPENTFRVFYEVDVENHVVDLVGIGIKRGSRLFFCR